MNEFEQRRQRDLDIVTHLLTSWVERRGNKPFSSAVLPAYHARYNVSSDDVEAIITGRLGWGRQGADMATVYLPPVSDTPPVDQQSHIPTPAKKPTRIVVRTYSEMPTPHNFGPKRNSDGAKPGTGDDGRHPADED